MKIVTKLINKRTNEIFVEPNPHLVAYAKDNPDFSFEYDEVPGEVEKSYSHDMLRAMNMKDLQTLAESLGVECDKRRKDDLIDGILKAGR